MSFTNTTNDELIQLGFKRFDDSDDYELKVGGISILLRLKNTYLKCVLEFNLEEDSIGKQLEGVKCVKDVRVLINFIGSGLNQDDTNIGFYS